MASCQLCHKHKMRDWKESGNSIFVLMEAYEDDYYYFFYFSVFSIYLTVLCYMYIETKINMLFLSIVLKYQETISVSVF